MASLTDTVVYLLSQDAIINAKDGSFHSAVNFSTPGMTYIPVKINKIHVEMARTLNNRNIPTVPGLTSGQTVSADLGETVQSVVVAGVLVQGAPLGAVTSFSGPSWVVDGTVFSRQGTDPTVADVSGTPNLDNLHVQIGLLMRAAGCRSRLENTYPTIGKIYWGYPVAASPNVSFTSFTQTVTNQANILDYLYGVDFVGSPARFVLEQEGGNTQSATFTLDFLSTNSILNIITGGGNLQRSV